MRKKILMSIITFVIISTNAIPVNAFYFDNTEINLYEINDYADYSKVDNALNKIPSDLTIYTNESVQYLNSIKNSIIRDKTSSEQSVVDGYADSINYAISNLKYKLANYTLVDNAIRLIPTDLTLYTLDTINVLNSITNSIDRNKKISEQDIVDEYALSIRNAIGNLQYKEADYTKVDEAIKSVPSNLDRYSAESRNALKNALNSVTRNKKITEQDVVDGYYKSIVNAIKALKSDLADYTKVNEALNKIPKDLSKYSEESLAKLKLAKDNVVNNKSIEEQETVNSYATAILNSISQLEIKKADFTKLDDVLTKLPENLDIYSVNSITNLKELIKKIDRNKTIDDQKEVDELAEKISDELKKIKLNEADYTMVDDLIKKVPDDLSLYSDESVKKLTEVLGNVIRGKNADEQELVNNYAIDISNALDNLELKNSSSNKVDNLIDKPNTEYLKNKYTIIFSISVVISIGIIILGLYIYRKSSKKDIVEKNNKNTNKKNIENDINLVEELTLNDNKCDYDDMAKDIFIDDVFSDTFDDIRILNNSIKRNDEIQNDTNSMVENKCQKTKRISKKIDDYKYFD